MNRADLGAELKRSNNCCQAVLLAFEDILPLDRDTLLLLGSHFGSGMGGMTPFWVLLMALGILSGQPKGMNGYSRKMFGAFEEQCGASRCIDIKGVVTGHMLCSCEDCVRNAIKLVEERI